MYRARQSTRSRPASTTHRCSWSSASRGFSRCRSRRFSMMTKAEDPHEDHPARLSPAALSALLGIIAACFAFNDLLAWNALRVWQPLGVLAMNLLIVGAIWGLLRLKPSSLRAAALLYLLGIVVVAGFSASANIGK